MPASNSDWADYKQAILASIPDLASRYVGLKGLRPSTDGWVTALCPFHDDANPSFAFEKTTGNWKCHGGCGQGTLIDYEAKVRGVTFKDALTALGDERGVPRPNGKDRQEAVYDYTDADGRLLYQVVRKPGKKWTQRRPDGNGGFIPNVQGIKRVLYHLKDLAARPDERVFVVEGEKDADRLAALRLLATTNAGGAGKWKDAYSEVLVGRDVVVAPDNDTAGRAHAEQVVRSLRGKARSVRVLALPGLPEKGDISDWLNAGNDIEALNALVAASEPIRQEDDHPATGLRPAIMTNGRQPIAIIDDIWKAIHAANDPPQVFISSGALARLSLAGDVPAIQLLDEHSALGLLMRVADWIRVSAKGTEDTEPKKIFAHDILSNPDLLLPRLDSVITTPVFDHDWRLITEPGYHPDAKLWLHLPAGTAPYDIPFKPTPDEVAGARSLIVDDLLVDFPFTAESDRAHAFAALLLPFARRMFDGPTPIHLIEAPTPGSGKSLLVDLISTIALGYCPGCTTLTSNEEESRKKLTAILSRGPSVIAIDNLKGGLHSAQVAAAITAEVWEDRLLGKTQMVAFPNRALWLASGNNPDLSTEIARRCVRIRIDTGEEQPWKRTGFKHDPIREWTKQNRHQLVRAILTLIQHWIMCGCPTSSEAMGSFEAWSRVVGGMVGHFGLPGFLGDTDAFYEAADPETGEWKAFIAAWRERFRLGPVSAGQLLELAATQGLIPFAIAGNSPQAQRVKLGKSLSAIRGRRFGDVTVEVAADHHAKAREYRLVEVTKDLFPKVEGAQ